jgi:hypothetical protein
MAIQYYGVEGIEESFYTVFNRLHDVSSNNGVEGSLRKAAKTIMDNLTIGSTIAIVYITAKNNEISEYIANELEFIMVNNGYDLVERNQVDIIRREQEFQMSGEVDDDTAVSIGKIYGANIIITGNVTGIGNLRRLRLRAVDTQTGKVIAVASEKY